MREFIDRIETIFAFAKWQIGKRLSFFFAVLFLLAIAFNFNADYYTGKWLGFGAVFVALSTLAIYRRYGPAAASCLGYVIALSLLSERNNSFALLLESRTAAGAAPYDLIALKLLTMEAAFKLLLILLPFLALPISLRKLEEWGSALACAFFFITLSSVFLEWWISGCVNVNKCGGVLGNPSINAGMVAVVMPLVFKQWPACRWILFALACAGVALGRSNVGLGMLAVFLFLHMLSTRNWKPIMLQFYLAPVAVYFLGPKLMSSGDRFLMWEFFLKAWLINPSHWLLGTGSGTFGVYSINLQKAFAVREGMWWIWAHNDFLEQMFTAGVVGLALMSWLYIATLRGLLRRGYAEEAQAFLLFGVFMCVNPALHIGLCCAFAAWLIALGLLRSKEAW